MSSLFGAIALVALAAPGSAAPPVIFEATSADRATGFRTMAECEAALGPAIAVRAPNARDKRMARGTAFNRRAGNVSRCEMVAGEPLIVVYPMRIGARVPR